MGDGRFAVIYLGQYQPFARDLNVGPFSDGARSHPMPECGRFQTVRHQLVKGK
jgi:hypothetical protein